MHIVPWASLVLLARAGYTQAATNEPSGVVEVDLVFPRNETCSPTEIMPVVFGFQNPEHAPLLGHLIGFTLWDLKNMSKPLVTDGFDLRWTNFSSSNGSTYYKYRPFIESQLKTERSWMLEWSFFWSNCTKESRSRLSSDSMLFNTSTWSVLSTTKSGARKMYIESISEG